jgi:hypothetical protein
MTLVDRVAIGGREWIVVPEERWAEWCARWEAERPDRACWGTRLIDLKHFMPWGQTVQYLRGDPGRAEAWAEANRRRWRRAAMAAKARHEEREGDRWLPCRCLGAWP